MAADPAREGWEVMGCERRQCVAAIELGRDEAAVGGALEQHHLKRPDAVARQRILESGRHGAEVLADDDAAIGFALLRGSRKKSLERKAHIGALVGAQPARDEIEPLETQDVIDPDRAGISHGCAQDLCEWRAAALDQAQGIDARKSPALPLGVELVRRRADLERWQDEILIAPGVKAVGADADGDIEIKPDREPGAVGLGPAGHELLVGDPLHKGMVIERLSVGLAEIMQRRLVRLAEFGRPFPPWRAEAPTQLL